MSSNLKNVSLDPFLPVCVIQLSKDKEGEAMKAITAAFEATPFINVCIAVDEDVDLYNMNDVMWAVVTRSKLEEDVSIVSDMLGFARDPFAVYKSKMAIDATFPLQHEEHFSRAQLIHSDINLDEYIEPAKEKG